MPLIDPLAVDIGFVNGHLADQFQQEPGFSENFVFVRSIAGEAVFLIMTAETAAAVAIITPATQPLVTPLQRCHACVRRSAPGGAGRNDDQGRRKDDQAHRLATGTQ
ncbi:hypothetical protein [uncultured Thiodictyon sp.]|uniref:hypothetical protein n=1 Tax=uncultured Thiodictyon sp. TaxID=1846217 RepID=UPI0025D61444|nr:hypothetical protein [uncultured Thiodictyon sp.]